MEVLIPPPVLFHPLKHHLGYIKEFIAWQGTAEGETAQLIQLLRTLGNSQMDLYLGKLSPQAIALEIIHQLEENQLYLPQAYRSFLEKGKGFQLLDTSDQTTWVLRWGEAEKRYIHIHPGRYAPHTMRVKATALKTAIAALIRTRQLGLNQPDLNLLNQVRQQWLDLSPARSVVLEEGVGKILSLLIGLDL